jgi:hypothetical protein
VSASGEFGAADVRQGATVSVIPQELIEKLFAHYLGVVERDPSALRNGFPKIEEI